jgi:hypothetical protein
MHALARVVQVATRVDRMVKRLLVDRNWMTMEPGGVERAYDRDAS